MKKYLVIKKEERCIKIIFVSKKDGFKHFNDYGIFIKNIGHDLRSKIEDFNIKLRLVNFFRDMEHVLLEDIHQITFDEYIELLRLSSLENKEEKEEVTFVKRK